MNPDSPGVFGGGEIAVGVPATQGCELASADVPTLAPRADIGVLLVHGIGNHREGATLRAFGQPLLDWLKDWLQGKGGKDRRGRVVVTEARFHDEQAPAYARAEVTVSVDATKESGQESWLFCEGWWGAAVQSPASFQLLRWMWTRGPLLIYWHFYIRQTEDEAKARPGVMDFFFIVLALLLAGFCQIVVGIAMLLSLIPIGPWRRKVVDAVRAMTLTLGDSYVLEEDIQRAALVDRVQRALDWLAKQTDKVVVIAHSQGGAIAHEVLRQNASNAAMFVTVGSGLEKLHFLREVVIGKKGLIFASLLFPLIVTGVVIAGSTSEHWARGLAGLIAFVALMFFTVLLVELDFYKKQLSDAVPDLELRSLGPKRWIDIYASDDVVPMNRGSLLATAHFLDRRRVYNEGSYVGDHLGYFTNVNDALPIMWQNLARLSRLAMFTSEDEKRLRNFAIVHKGYTHVISFSRLALFVAVFIAGYVLRSSLLEFGRSVLATVEGTIVEDWLKPVRGLAAMLASIIKRFGKADSITPEILTGALFGALILLVIIALWWVIFRAIWVARCRARWRNACRGGDVLQGRWGRISFVAACTLFLCFGCLPLIVSIILKIRPDYFTIARLGNVVAIALAALALFVALLFTTVAPLAAESSWQDPSQTWLSRVLAPLFVLLPAQAALWLVKWLWPGLDPWLVAAAQAASILLFAISWQVFGVIRLRRNIHSGWLAAIVGIPIAGTAIPFLFHYAPSYGTAVLIYSGFTAAVLITTFLVRRLNPKQAQAV
jgi:pimeloyl-ACP methyl ester carboxylesterase